ncbi:MAG TPA: filamentous hemagglutinin N-terminal domain-containing protein, partial [Paracoccaceae bacterium]|nr:filamentous hemagglutinin N-terminal domain-containing protein [Paracoccaceae bacterium]
MISGEYRALSRPNRGPARFRTYLLGRTALCGALTLVIAAGIAPRAAQAGPEGTVVVGGAVDIAKSGTHTEFTQATQTAILNHDSFDIRANESVNFAQPNSYALAVNRIIGSDLPTSIAGKLTANGNVWVLNPSGVAIHGTAQVNVGGLIATSASIADEAIMAGERSFAGAPDGSAVTNAGSITAGEGSVVLVAPVVENTGTITANGSDVALGAGSGFTVDFAGDGLTRFQVTPGEGVSLTNTGTISARGGAAYLSAASAEAVRSSVVSIGGRVEATRIEERGGTIVITGGEHG